MAIFKTKKSIQTFKKSNSGKVSLSKRSSWKQSLAYSSVALFLLSAIGKSSALPSSSELTCNEPTSNGKVASISAADIQSDLEGQSSLCGICVNVSGPDGNVVAEVRDVCKDCTSGHISLSKEAFTAINKNGDDKAAIRWNLVPCENVITGSVAKLPAQKEDDKAVHTSDGASDSEKNGSDMPIPSPVMLFPGSSVNTDAPLQPSTTIAAVHTPTPVFMASDAPVGMEKPPCPKKLAAMQKAMAEVQQAEAMPTPEVLMTPKMEELPEKPPCPKKLAAMQKAMAEVQQAEAMPTPEVLMMPKMEDFPEKPPCPKKLAAMQRAMAEFPVKSNDGVHETVLEDASLPNESTLPILIEVDADMEYVTAKAEGTPTPTYTAVATPTAEPIEYYYGLPQENVSDDKLPQVSYADDRGYFNQPSTEDAGDLTYDLPESVAQQDIQTESSQTTLASTTTSVESSTTAVFMTPTMASAGLKTVSATPTPTLLDDGYPTPPTDDTYSTPQEDDTYAVPEDQGYPQPPSYAGYPPHPGFYPPPFHGYPPFFPDHPMGFAQPPPPAFAYHSAGTPPPPPRSFKAASNSQQDFEGVHLSESQMKEMADMQREFMLNRQRLEMEYMKRMQSKMQQLEVEQGSS